MLAACTFLAMPARAGDACPAPLADATSLVLVTTPDMQSVVAKVRRFARDAPGAAWTAVGTPWPAVVGRKGLGWGLTYGQDAAAGEADKREGDQRTPAGFFILGSPFGFAASPLASYLRLEPGQSVCVDDPNSRSYNAIVSRAAAGNGTSGEEMWRVPQYRRGLLVDYPTNRQLKGGSCIFVHIWRAPSSGTVGCVALAEANVTELQAWSHAEATTIGILPEQALARFRGCLPGILEQE